MIGNQRVSGPQGSRHYPVSTDGLIHNVAPDDLVQLLSAGCEPTTLAPPLKPEPAKVRLRAPRPHMVFAPDPDHSTVRYTADADRFIDVAEEHVKMLMRAGCARLKLD